MVESAGTELPVLVRSLKAVEDGGLTLHPGWAARIGESIPEAEIAATRKLKPDELVRATAGKPSLRRIKQYQTFKDYWNASSNSFIGKGYEALIANSENPVLLGRDEILIPAAALGKAHDAADLIRIDLKTGKITGLYQAKLNLGDVNDAAKLLKDERYLGQPILTTQTSYDKLLRDVAKREASLAQRGLPASTELAEVKEALSSGRIPERLPGGGPLMARGSIEEEVQTLYERVFRRLSTSGERGLVQFGPEAAIRRFGRFVCIDGPDSAVGVLRRVEKGWEAVPTAIKKLMLRRSGRHAVRHALGAHSTGSSRYGSRRRRVHRTNRTGQCGRYCIWPCLGHERVLFRHQTWDRALRRTLLGRVAWHGDSQLEAYAASFPRSPSG